MAYFWIITVVSLILCHLPLFAQTMNVQSGKSAKKSLKGYPKDKVVRDAFSSDRQIIAQLRGDVVIGAMVPVHLSSDGVCSELYLDGVMLTEAILFAVREARRRRLLSDNVTLGYEIRDTCNSVKVAQRHTLEIVSENTQFDRNRLYLNDSNRKIKPQHATDCKQFDNNVIAVVGAGNSEVSVAVNRVLSAFDIPQIGFASTSRYLSDKRRFPSFFRTVPSDTYQVKGLVALFQRFGWNYVGLLVSDGAYGRPLASSFRSLAKEKRICVTYDHLVPFNVNKADANAIVRKLKAMNNVEIIVMLLPESDVTKILDAIVQMRLENKTLVASDSWSKSIKDYKFSKIVTGTVGLANYDKRVKTFEKHFLALKPDVNISNPWFNKSWEHIFNCVLSNDQNKKLLTNDTKPRCNLEKQRLKKTHFKRFHYIGNVINSVFAIVNGVQKFCKTVSLSSTGSSKGSAASCLSSLTSQKLLETLKGMTFYAYDGRKLTFDKDGSIVGKYNVVNIYPNLTAKNVGMWNGASGKLTLNMKEFVWNTMEESPPKGVCSAQCPAGSYQALSKRDPQCCWTCQRCLSGTVSKQAGKTRCTPCQENFMANQNQTACVYIPLNYLNWRSFWTVSIVLIAVISVSLLLLVSVLFVRYRNTPVVKASNRELSFILFFGLFLTFLVPFVFAGKPSNVKCIISQVMFCVGCALALSAMLFRTLRIVLLFKFTGRKNVLLKNKYQIGMTILLTLAELTYCLLWVAINPPGVKTVMVNNSERYLVCHFNKYWYAGSHVLLIVLSILCTALAVKGRKLPKNFNEVRHIGFSMFTFNIVWVVFMCAQYGASLEYDVKINCFAMITSSLMILVLLFGPKVFILLFRSHLNRKEEFEAEVRRYSFAVPNGNLSTRSFSVTSLRRGSAVVFQSSSPSNNQFLSVNSNDSKRNRSSSFDAVAGQIYQNKGGMSRSCSKGTQTTFLKDYASTFSSTASPESSPILVRITDTEESIRDVNKHCDSTGSTNDKIENYDDSIKKDVGRCTTCQQVLRVSPRLTTRRKGDRIYLEVPADPDVEISSFGPTWSSSMKSEHSASDNFCSKNPADETSKSPMALVVNHKQAAFSDEFASESMYAELNRNSRARVELLSRKTPNKFHELDMEWDYESVNLNSPELQNEFVRETLL